MVDHIFKLRWINAIQAWDWIDETRCAGRWVNVNWLLVVSRTRWERCLLNISSGSPITIRLIMLFFVWKDLPLLTIDGPTKLEPIWNDTISPMKWLCKEQTELTVNDWRFCRRQLIRQNILRYGSKDVTRSSGIFRIVLSGQPSIVDRSKVLRSWFTRPFERLMDAF